MNSWSSRALLVSVAALLLCVQPAVFAAQPASTVQFHVNQVTVTIRYLPTTANFAMPHVQTGSWPVKSGDLICRSRALDDCLVDHMPLLWQLNPELQAPLISYAARYELKNGPNKGKIVWSEPQFSPPIGPTPYAPSDFAQNLAGNGCYITSLTTIMNAALANLPPGVGVRGRAAIFKEIHAGQFLKGKRPINQLQWQYRRWADKLQPNSKDPSQPSSPDFLEFTEFASDLTPNAQAPVLDPTTINAHGIADKMKGGTYFLIPYSRYVVHASPPDGAGNIELTLSYDSHHKVAISGFQPGKYPLLIDDVGNGKRYRVRVTSDIRSIPMRELRGGANVTLPASKLVLVKSPWPHPVFLVYEGQDGEVVDRGGEVFLVEEYDTLKLTRPNMPRPVHSKAP